MEKLSFFKLDELSSSPPSNPSFEVSINPEQISITRGIKFEEEESSSGGRSEGSTKKFKSIDPQKISINLMLDGTGVIEGTETRTVDGDIEELSDLIYTYHGDKHRPNYIYIQWGDAVKFRGMLSSMKIDYTLFSPTGKTLRAKIALNFEEMMEPSNRATDVNKSSPDMTHAKLIRMGDRLPLMANEIYGDFDYFIEVARSNKLVNFRRLSPGSKLMFPPLEK